MSDVLMAVTIRDRSKESPWGVGLTDPRTTTVRIRATCPRCGGPRGEARRGRWCDDGAWYSADAWENPCGHRDLYADVVQEADRLEVELCRCVEFCAEGGPAFRCSLHGTGMHTHPDDGLGVMGPCPVHPDAPGDH